MLSVITAIMNVAFTIFAVYGIFVLRKWHRVAVETESVLIEMRNDLQEEEGEKQGRCCPHEFYDSVEQAIDDSEDGVPCDHLIEVAPVRHGRWLQKKHKIFGNAYDYVCSECGCDYALAEYNYCPNCGAKMDGGVDDG